MVSLYTLAELLVLPLMKVNKSVLSPCFKESTVMQFIHKDDDMPVMGSQRAVGVSCTGFPLDRFGERPDK